MFQRRIYRVNQRKPRYKVPSESPRKGTGEKLAGGGGGGRGGLGGGDLGFFPFRHCSVLILSLAIVTSDDQTESRRVGG